MTKWILVMGACGLGTLAGTPATHAQALPATESVAMPDGVTLTTDIWRPLFDNSPRPVLLRRTPYGRGVDALQAQNLVAAGYNVVSQDVRGKGGSGGTFEPFFDDKVDGKATIDWIAKQPWSNGRVGTYSASAEGIVQYMAMAAAPEALSCAHVAMPTHDVYGSLLPGGAWRTDLNTNWLVGQGAANVVDLWKAHEVRDAYWDDATLSTDEMAAIDHPVFIVGGMFDIFSADEVRALAELQANVAEESRDDVFLVIGPWTHGGIGVRQQGELLYPMEATYVDYVTDLVAYFDHCLRSGPKPAFPAVRYYLTEVSDESVLDPTDNVMRIVASGEWREADTWPPPELNVTAMYVQADDALDGTRPTDDGDPIVLALDPADPLPSLGGGNLTTAAGPYDQQTIDMRPDVFTVQTAPVTELVEIVGNVHADLWVASATTDLDMIVRLEVLTPTGRAVALTDGVLRGRFAAGTDAIRPLVPGEPTAFAFDLGPAALRLPPGYALRFAFSGASAPRYEPNPNTATPLAEKPTVVPTTLTLFRDAQHPSKLSIPVVKGRLPGTVDEAPASDAGGDPGAIDPGSLDGGFTRPPAVDAGGAADGSSQAGGSELPDDADADAVGCGCRLHERARGGSGRLFAPLLLGLFLWRRRRAGERASYCTAR